MDWLELQKLRLGGFRDSWAVASIGGAYLLSSPYFGTVSPMVSFGLAAAGGMYLGGRVFDTWRRKATLADSVGVKSDEPPLSVNPGEPCADGMLIGYCADTGKPFILPDEDLMRHCFLLGQSGVGKTVLGRLMMFQQIQRGAGLLFIDGKMNKQELETIYMYCKWAGREKDFLVINPGDPSMSNTYNPILEGDPDEVAARILSLIPDSSTSPGADYYRQAANQGLATIVAALKAANLAYNFIDLTILLMNPKALGELERLTPAGSAAKTNLSLFLDQFRMVDKDGKSGIDMKRLKETFGGIAGRMYMFGTNQFGQVMNSYTPEVDLFDAMVTNKIVYIMLPTMGKNEAAQNLGKMVIGDLRTAVSWVQKLPEKDLPWPPFFVFMDEAGSYVSSTIARLFEQARSAHIAMMPAVQTVANLQTVSEELAEMATGSTWTKFVFKVGTQESALFAAELIGMKKGIVRAMGMSDTKNESAQFVNPSDPNFSVGHGGGMSYTEREQEDYRVSADVIKALGKGECIVLYGGEKIYNLKIPMLSIGKDFAKANSEVKLNHYPKRFRKSIDLFTRADQLLSRGDMSDMSNQVGKEDRNNNDGGKPSVGKRVDAKRGYIQKARSGPAKVTDLGDDDE